MHEGGRARFKVRSRVRVPRAPGAEERGAREEGEREVDLVRG